MAKITETVMERLAPPADDKERATVVKDDTLSGFQAVCTKSGRKHTEVFKRLPRGGRLVRIKVGDWPAMKIPEARRRAHEYLAKIAAGIDPIAERKEIAAAGTTLRDAIDDYLKDPLGKLKESTKTTAKRALNQVQMHGGKEATKLLDTPISQIPASQVRLVHHLHSQASAAAADGFMRIASAAVSAHFDAVYGDDDDLPRNPIKCLTRKKDWNHVPAKTRHIEDDWLGPWWKATEELVPDLRWYLRLCLLTGCRKSELLGLRWENVDSLAGTLTFIGTKNGSNHCLPITQGILDCLPIRPTTDAGLVFGKVTESRLRRALRKIEQSCGRYWALHDLRRTAGTIANRCGVSGYTVKKLLNHTPTSRDVTQSVYLQIGLDDLRDALGKIAHHIQIRAITEGAVIEDRPVLVVVN